MTMIARKFVCGTLTAGRDSKRPLASADTIFHEVRTPAEHENTRIPANARIAILFFSLQRKTQQQVNVKTDFF